MLTKTAITETLPEYYRDLHLRINSATEDDLLDDYAWSAIDTIEDEADITVLPTTYSYVIPAFEPLIYLPKPPITAVNFVKYYDSDNSLQTYSSDNYYFVSSDRTGAFLAPKTYWPITYRRPDCIQISYDAGKETPDPQIRSLIRLLVATQYNFREGETTKSTSSIKHGIDYLMKKVTHWRYR